MRTGKGISPVLKILIYAAACVFVAFIVAIAIPRIVGARLSRASNACVNNLRQIDSAKQQWALENRKPPGAILVPADLALYFGNNQLPICPQGGNYTMGRVGEDPSCSASDADWPNSHSLNGPPGGWWHEFKMAYANLFNGRAFSGPYKQRLEQAGRAPNK
jgi:hypothetical protein